MLAARGSLSDGFGYLLATNHLTVFLLIPVYTDTLISPGKRICACMHSTEVSRLVEEKEGIVSL